MVKNIIIEDGVAKINHDCKPSIISIVKKIRKQGFKGPLLLRFPHITKKQIKTLYTTFNSSIKEYDYKGKFNAVFPLKVNQLPNFVHPLTSAGKKYNYGLEAGSKLLFIFGPEGGLSPAEIESFTAKGAIFFTASLMPAALFFVETMYTWFLNISAPGFSTYIPVTTGIPSSSLIISQTVPQATP